MMNRGRSSLWRRVFRWVVLFVVAVLALVMWRRGSFDLPAPPSTYSSGAPVNVDPGSDVKEIDAGSFGELIEKARAHPRKRYMTDYTKDPANNELQTILNTWTSGHH